MNCARLSVMGLLAAAAVLLGSSDARAQARPPPPVWVDPAGPPVEMNVWLRRLVGRYHLEGMVHVVARGDCAPPQPAPDDPAPAAPPEPLCQSIQGMGDCVAVGTGPGVQCVLNAAWKDMYEVVHPKSDSDSVNVEPAGVFNVPGGVSYLDPAMMLLGLDPGAPGIHYLLVDDKGLPEGGMGVNTGNRATFRTKCVNAPILLNAIKPESFNGRMPDACDRTLRIEAKADARIVNMTVDIEINEEVFTRLLLTMRRVAATEHIPPASGKPAK